MKLNTMKFKKGDYILIAVLLVVAVAIHGFYAFQKSPEEIPRGETYAQIKVNGEIYQTVKLTQETQMIKIRTKRGYDLLRVRDFGIEVVESDCPEKICFTFGHIRKSNEEIICLPLRMHITIVGGEPSDDELDAIVS